MLITTKFFVGLDQIELQTTTMRGERFGDLYFLTTDKGKIADIARPYASSLGRVEISYLTDGGAKALVYRISEQEVDETDPGSSLSNLLVQDMLAIKSLQRHLWMVKDNAAHFDRGWIVATIPRAGIVVNNNVWASRQTCADGTYRNVRFDSESLSGKFMRDCRVSAA